MFNHDLLRNVVMYVLHLQVAELHREQFEEGHGVHRQYHEEDRPLCENYTNT